jgi:hypothetical protein
MAFALPAAKGPTEQGPHDQPAPLPPVEPWHPARRQDHGRDRRDQQQLDDARLRQGHVGTDRIAGRVWAPPRRLVVVEARSGSVVRADRHGPRGVEARHGQPDDHREDDRGEGEVQGLGPSVELGQDLEAADDHLDRVEHGDPDGQPDEAPSIALGPPGEDRQDGDEDADERRDPAMEDVR